jgi:hypothetical protein
MAAIDRDAHLSSDVVAVLEPMPWMFLASRDGSARTDSTALSPYVLCSLHACYRVYANDELMPDLWRKPPPLLKPLISTGSWTSCSPTTAADCPRQTPPLRTRQHNPHHAADISYQPTLARLLGSDHGEGAARHSALLAGEEPERPSSGGNAGFDAGGVGNG